MSNPVQSIPVGHVWPCGGGHQCPGDVPQHQGWRLGNILGMFFQPLFSCFAAAVCQSRHVLSREGQGAAPGAADAWDGGGESWPRCLNEGRKGRGAASVLPIPSPSAFPGVGEGEGIRGSQKPWPEGGRGAGTVDPAPQGAPPAIRDQWGPHGPGRRGSRVPGAAPTPGQSSDAAAPPASPLPHPTAPSIPSGECRAVLGVVMGDRSSGQGSLGTVPGQRCQRFPERGSAGLPSIARATRAAGTNNPAQPRPDKTAGASPNSLGTCGEK